MAVTLSPVGGAAAQFFDNNGNPLSGGKLYTYSAGTSTPRSTFTTSAGTVAHSNPIILDAAGRVPDSGEIWLTVGVGYKFVIKTSTDVLLSTYDNVPSAAQPPAANDADAFMYEQGYTVAAGGFVVGKTYRIVSVGTTDFTLIGALSNAPGVHFIATGPGAGTGTAELSQTVETKLRQTASVLDFGAVGDGVTDDTAAIQAALNAARQVIFPANRTYLIYGCQIPSDTHLVFEANTVVKLGDNANRPAFQNTNWQSTGWNGATYGLDKNITIDGLYLDGNQANQARIGTGIYAGEFTTGVRLFGVTNLVLRNITIYQSKTFAFWLCAIRFLTAHDIIFDQFLGGLPANQDGLHINGPATSLDIRNLQGTTNDDMIALNADDAYLGIQVTNGPIIDVVVDGLFPSNSLTGIRMLSGVSRMDRIIITNVVGTTRDAAVYQSTYGLGSGNTGTITIENVDVICGPFYQPFFSNYFAVISLEGGIETILIRNVRWNNRGLDSRPVVLLAELANLGNITIDTIQAYTATSFAPPDNLIVFRGISCANMVVRNINWYREATLAQNGTVLRINPSSPAHGINTLSCFNWSVNRCSNLIEQNRGFLNTLFVRDILSTNQLNGSAIMFLGSGDPSVTNIDSKGCNTNAAVFIRAAASSIGPRSIIEPAGLSNFWALANVDQAIPAAVWTKINFNNRLYSGADEYDGVTSTFLVKQAQGIYSFSWAVQLTTATPNTTVGFAIYVNGVRAAYVGNSNENVDVGVVLSAETKLSVQINDLVTLYIYADNPVTILGGFQSTQFAGFRIA